jgi:hypothetical protein
LCLPALACCVLMCCVSCLGRRCCRRCCSVLLWIGRYPLKARPGGGGGAMMMMPNQPLTTSYFTVAFCVLPDMPMVPRPVDHRVGYFAASTSIGSPTQLTVGHQMITRWNLARRGNKVLFCISHSTPRVYHDTIKKGVLSWNAAFAAAGYVRTKCCCFPLIIIDKNIAVLRSTKEQRRSVSACCTLVPSCDRYDQPVLQCLAPDDVGFPEDLVKGDARYNVIAMAEPPGLLGYGPSIVDFRSGEILVAHVLLGLTAFSQNASRWSAEPNAAHKPVWSGRGCRMPLLDPTHPWILAELLHTVAHEVGHTLGLRHNFIASEDGHTSVMAYEDPVDTTHLDPLGPAAGALAVSSHRRTIATATASGGPVTSSSTTNIGETNDDVVRFGAHYCMGPGLYDVYAIRYGYTRLPGESRTHRHPGLDLLANGQDHHDAAGLSAQPRNPLFMTDENLCVVSSLTRAAAAAALAPCLCGVARLLTPRPRGDGPSLPLGRWRCLDHILHQVWRTRGSAGQPLLHFHPPHGARQDGLRTAPTRDFAAALAEGRHRATALHHARVLAPADDHAFATLRHGLHRRHADRRQEEHAQRHVAG